MTTFRSGVVAIVGRPNTGKSTLLNRLVGQHVSITSHRAQTTRFRILGINTTGHAQVVYVDTPGLHPPAGRRLNRYMNRIAAGSLEGVDCVILVIESVGWKEGDEYPLDLLRRQGCPVILAINKIDRIRNREQLLPLLQESSGKMNFAEYVPISALKGAGVAELEQAVIRHLPEQGPIYAADQLTDKNEAFLAAELVREQIFRGFGHEVPYDAAVLIDRFHRKRGLLHVAATIVVEKEGQKAILIGRGGERLKGVGQRARLAMQKLFRRKVHLELWVKVRKGWAESERELRGLGYAEER
jgi:GTP-binding protein Era